MKTDEKVPDEKTTRRELTEAELRAARLLWARSRVTACERVPYITSGVYQFAITEEAMEGPVRIGGEMFWDPHAFHLLLEEDAKLAAGGAPRQHLPEPAAVGAFHVLHEFGHFLLNTQDRCKAHRSVSAQGDLEPADPQLFWMAGCVAVNDWLSEALPLDSYTGLHPDALSLPRGKTHEFYYEQLKAQQPRKLRGGDGHCEADRKRLSPQDRMFGDAVRAAVASVAPLGTSPGEEMLQFKALYAPQANLTKKLTLSVLHAHRAGGRANLSFSKLHRKQAALGFGADSPRLVGRQQISYEPVAVILDTSGSVVSMQKELDQFATEFNSLVKAGVQVFLIVTDTVVQSAGYVTEFQQAAKMLKGGGGTMFNAAFDRLRQEEEKTRFAGCFILTDGEIYGVPEAQPFRTKPYWVVYGGAPKPASWGELIRIARDER